MPDRHIFRVDGNGAAEPTGKTAPPEPNRAIARFDRKAAPVAVEAPPRSLRVPEEPAQIATPTRRRGRPRKADSVQLELAQVVPVAALTGSTEAAAPKRRGRPPKVAVAAAAAPAVAAPAKRGPKPKTAAVVEDAPALKRRRSGRSGFGETWAQAQGGCEKSNTRKESSGRNKIRRHEEESHELRRGARSQKGHDFA